MKPFKRKTSAPPQPADPKIGILPTLSDTEKAQQGHIFLRALYKQLSSRFTKNDVSRELSTIQTPVKPALSPLTAPQSLALASLKDALRQFSLVAAALPSHGSGLKSISDIFLASLGNMQETPEMSVAFQRLAGILRGIHDFLCKISAKGSCSADQTEIDKRIVHEIQQRMATITSDVHAAVTQGTHASFFDMSNGGSAIFSHFSKLEVILGAITENSDHYPAMSCGYRVEEAHIVQKSVYTEGVAAPVTREFKNLVAAQGGAGGKAQEGGSGGEGGGFTIMLDATQSYRFEGLQTGAGGEGGEGVVKGGVGGAAGWFKIG